MPLPRNARALMIQGTGSDVGKSLLVAGLARAFTRRGLSVLPFKPQNMSNNAAVTRDGGEIGRAQALQAKACGVAPERDFNPVLLKPESDQGSQVVVHGRVQGRVQGAAYRDLKPQLMNAVLESFGRLAARADLVLVEGAGSPAEVNLRAGDIANMGFALQADVPVVLVGDVDRGGVIAQLVGTHALLPADERALLQGYIVNKFRGDLSLFDGATDVVRDHTQMQCFGVVPYFPPARLLPQEDSASLDAHTRQRTDETAEIIIAVPRLPRIANFDDLDPLACEPNVRVIMVAPNDAWPRHVHAIVLPGSKSTLSDLAALRAQGWDKDIISHARAGGVVVGICGGYQMLGQRLSDPQGVEGPAGSADGLGLLEIDSVMTGDKTLELASGIESPSGRPVEGYEMHMGLSDGAGRARPWLTLADGRGDGAVSPDGRVMGGYMHGVFASDGFRHDFLARLRTASDSPQGIMTDTAQGASYDAGVEAALDGLADHLEKHLNLDAILAVAR